jgi:hypothetical protein
MVRMVVTTAPADIAPVAVGVTVEGVSVQVESTGAPAQVNATGVVKPLSPVTVTVKLAVLPAATLAVVGITVMPKSGLPVVPVPVRTAVCGLPASLSVTLNVAVAAPAVVGRNVTLMVQLAPTASVLPQLLVCANNADDTPPMVTEMEVAVAALLLVRVTVCPGLVVLMVWLPNATVVGARNTAVGATETLPTSETICGLPEALSAMLRAAVSVEFVEGVKIMPMVQLEFVASVVEQVEVPCVKSPALAPVNETVMPLSVVPELL